MVLNLIDFIDFIFALNWDCLLSYMISSEPTLGNPSKKDVPDHLLSKIFPLFGFDYEPASEPCIRHNISKSKSPKGITIISKQ